MWNSVLVTKLQALRQNTTSIVVEGKDGLPPSPFSFNSSIDPLLGVEGEQSALLNFSFKNSIFDLDNFDDEDDESASSDDQLYEFSVYNSEGEEEESGIVSHTDVMGRWIESSAENDTESVGRAAHALECAFVDALSSSFWTSTTKEDFPALNSRSHSIFQRTFGFFGEHELDEEITQIEREIAKVEEQKRKLHNSNSSSTSSPSLSSATSTPIIPSSSTPSVTNSIPNSPFSSPLHPSTISSPSASTSSTISSHFSPVRPIKRSSSYPLSLKYESDMDHPSTSSKSIKSSASSSPNSGMTSPCASPTHSSGSGDDHPIIIASTAVTTSVTVKHSSKSSKSSQPVKRQRLTSSASNTKQVNSARKPKLIEKESNKETSITKRRKLSSSASSHFSSSSSSKSHSSLSSSSKGHHNNNHVVDEIFKLEQVLKIQTASNEADEDEEVDIL